MAEGPKTCRVCESQLERPPDLPVGDATEIACIRCGRFALPGSAISEFITRVKNHPYLRWILSHEIRKAQRTEGRPQIDSTTICRLDESGHLPSPAEQAENLLIWLAYQIKAPGERARISDPCEGGIAGTAGADNFHWLIKHLINSGLLEGAPDSAGAVVTLSYRGWQAVEELRRGRTNSRKAFMAMQYGDAQLNEVVDRCFRPAVRQTGFELELLTDRPRAGLIDDRLRVEIKLSRFLVADLSHGNPGAYWEAGYAEGLGKPVIYTCDKKVFDERKTHFDTNHHLTVPWEGGDLAGAADRLKATIRATMPDAKLKDE